MRIRFSYICILNLHLQITQHYSSENWICNTVSPSESASSTFFSPCTTSEISAYGLVSFVYYLSFCIMKHTYESDYNYCDCLWLFLAASSTIYLIILWVYHLNLLYMQVQSKWSLLPHPIFQKKFSCTINLMRSLPTPLWLLNVVCVGTRPLDFIMVCMHVKVVR